MHAGNWASELMMPLWDRPLNLIPGNRHRKRIMELEQATGVKAILSCIDQRYFTPEWLGRPIDRKCIEDMQPLVGPPGKGIDVSGEPGEYHSTSLDAPLFKQRVEITRFTKQSRVIDFGGSPFQKVTSSTWTSKKPSSSRKTQPAPPEKTAD